MRGILSLFGLGKSKPVAAAAQVPALDPALGDPDARALIAAAKCGEWRAIESALAKAPTGSDREFFISAVSEIGGYPQWIIDWKNEMPRSPHAFLFGGAMGVRYAWEARGSGYSETVTRDMFQEFCRRLNLADELLQSAATLAPDDATPWIWKITIARGLQLGLDECRARFEQAVKRNPATFFAHEQFLQVICKKWFGSHDEMFEFARTAARTAPAGSRLPVLIAHAHAERWLAAASDKEPGAETYFAQPAVIAELNEALRKWTVGANAARGAVADRNYFAFSFWKAGRKDLASEQFAAIGPNISDLPWCFLGDPVRRFHAAAAECSASTVRRAA